MTVLNFPASPALNETYTENGVLYTWNGSYWDAADSDSFDDRYVEVIGDTMTGQLTLPGGGSATQALQKQEIESLVSGGTYWDRSGGTLSPEVSSDNVNIGGGKITLNADGRINAASEVNIGAMTDAGGGTVIGRDGFMRVARPSEGPDWFPLFAAKKGSTDTMSIDTDGTTKIGGTLPSAPNIELKADGTAEFNGGALKVTNDDYLSVHRNGVRKGYFGFPSAGSDHFHIYNEVSNGNVEIATNSTKRLVVDSTGNVKIGNLSSTPNITLAADGSITAAGTAKFGGTVGIGGETFAGGDVVLGTLTSSGDYISQADRKIILKATDGSAEFAGEIQVGGSPAGGSNLGIDLRPHGAVVITTENAGDAPLTIYNTDATTTSRLATKITSEGNITAADYTSKNSNGTALVGLNGTVNRLINFVPAGQTLIQSNSDVNVDIVGSNNFKVKTGGVERFSIDGAGDAKFGGSVSIGGTADANTIDEYEEGTFNFTVTNYGGSAITFPLTNVVGKYIVVGNLVTLYMTFETLDSSMSGRSFMVVGIPLDNGANSFSVASACIINGPYSLGSLYAQYCIFNNPIPNIPANTTMNVTVSFPRNN